MPTPDIIYRLVNQFKINRDTYCSEAYNEAQLRQEFLNPFFEALGWDVANKKGFAIQYREVVHEDRIDIEGSKKAPDYAFRIGGVRKFFVEAKKPAENIETDASLAYQLRRYAWNAHLPLSILTDFEEFAVYDCRDRPHPEDSPATSRIMLLRFEDYIEKWDEIAAIFSPDAILKGAFDRYAEDNTGKRGTIQVDDAFLADIEEWRTLLARNIALRNPQVEDERQLNFAVQMTIDRIIFLRICEDREIEAENQLLEISQQPNIYDNLIDLFYRADLRYNSGLFHFKSDKRQNSENDSLTPTLVIDDKVLKEIIKDLYYPSPYIFKEIPVEILGQVYEQFLGKVIRLTAGHRAKVEEKPEVRKAGGVYYTPKYIVDYIVENTVGELVKGKTPKDAAELKIVDPACGSGSFLLGAFQYLLNWHEKWYLEHSPEEWAQGDGSPLAPTVDGSWRLSTDEKKRILLNNIYGVDIDPQAVEVTKLSLLLKVLEGETGQMSLGFERVLPDLGENIQCGNSLISNEFYLGRQLTLFDEDERYRINAFDWINAFPEVFNREGFDAVIGNPPYIRIQAMKEWAPTESEYYKEKYVSASKGNFDIYVVFIEKGLNILNSNGLMGFILPNKFFNSQYGEKIRNLISGENFLSRIVDFTDQQVFDNATTYTCLLFLDKRGRNEFNYSRVYDIENWKVTKSSLSGKLKSIDAKRNAWNFFVGEESKVLGKLENFPIRLSEITDNISQGIRTSANKIYVVLAEREISENVVLTFSKELQSEVTLEKELLHQFLKGQEIRRYNITYSNSLVIIPYSESNGNFQLISESELESNYPLTYNYLLENKRLLENREHGRMRGEDWYGYVYPKNFELMSKKKILTPDIADRCNFAYDETGDFSFTSGYCITLKSDKESDYFYILGILNSKLIDFFFKRISTPLQNGYFRFFSQYLNKIPVCLIDFSNENQSNTYNRIVELVKNLRYLNREIRKILSPNETDRLKRQIDATDAEIDRLVYELYGLTDEEIRIVEESVP